MSIVDWKWVACYLDCEGTVGLWDARGKQGGVRTLNWYNTHEPSLQMMQEFMGVGNLGGRWRSAKSLGKKRQYALTVSNKKDLVYVLTNIIPFLVIKRQAAEELLQHLVENVDDTRARNFGKLLAIPREDYERWYVTERKSLADIASLLDATPSGVYRLLRLHDIETRPAGGSDLKGKPKSEETKARMRAARQKLWEDPEFAAAQIAQMKEGRAASGYRVSAKYTKPAIQGEHHPRSKLSDAQTAVIRQRYAAGGVSLQQLADEHGVSKKTILNIVHDRIRTNVLSFPGSDEDAMEPSMTIPKTQHTFTFAPPRIDQGRMVVVSGGPETAREVVPVEVPMPGDICAGVAVSLTPEEATE